MPYPIIMKIASNGRPIGYSGIGVIWHAVPPVTMWFPENKPLVVPPPQSVQVPVLSMVNAEIVPLFIMVPVLESKNVVVRTRETPEFTMRVPLLVRVAMFSFAVTVTVPEGITTLSLDVGTWPQTNQ
jgi:hypothetical protein